MKNKLPLLSICIPTYNREKYLKECLESIVHQDGFNLDKIEIVISDNASQDNTEQLVNFYIEKYQNIHFFRNEENIGAILNVLNIIDKANGEYCWLLSDDDALEDYSKIIREILDIIEIQRFDQMFVNYRVYNKDFTKMIDGTPLKFIRNDITFYNNLSFLHWISDNDDYSAMLLFISIRIFKKDFWLKNKNVIDIIRDNPNVNLHPHTSILINNIEEQKVIINSNFYIKARDDNYSWDSTDNNGTKLVILLYKFLYKQIQNSKFKIFIGKGILRFYFILFLQRIKSLLLTKK